MPGRRDGHVVFTGCCDRRRLRPRRAAARSRARRRRPVGHALRPRRRRGRPGARRQDAVLRARRRRAARAPDRQRTGSTRPTDPARPSPRPSTSCVVVGTPVDEHLNPDPKFVLRAIEGLLDHLRDGQHLVLRSTVYPGVTAMVEQLLARPGATIDVSFCPERIAEGKALEELRDAAADRLGPHRARRCSGPRSCSARLTDVDRPPRRRGGRARQALHQHLALHQVRGRQPAVHDRQRLRPRLRAHPRRARRRTTRAPPTCPGPGLAAGPCLLKDTMQLAAFNNNNFTLGHASMMINEGLPAVPRRPARAAATTCRR